MQKHYRLTIEFDFDDEIEDLDQLCDPIVDFAATHLCCNDEPDALCTRDWSASGTMYDPDEELAGFLQFTDYPKG